MQSIYSIVITGSTSAAPSDGFIDPTTISQYMAQNDAAPSSLANSLAKTRANYRYKMLVQQLQLNANIYIAEFTAAGADCNTAPTSLTLQAIVEHGDDSIYCYDETTNYTTTLTGIPALTRMCARALCESETLELPYYDPTVSQAPGNTTTAARMGIRIDTVTVGQVIPNASGNPDLTTAASKVTITKIA